MCLCVHMCMCEREYVCVLLRLPCKNEEKKEEPWSEDRNQAVVPQVQA